ncbi:MAG TPA: hypothetical protein PLG10_02595 [Candidatus Dojkabacteria bacterium]|jgi:ATP-dependent Zn protease|nr:hypothetical protein [Candidatus Dojkabacteria bacterium]
MKKIYKVFLIVGVSLFIFLASPTIETRAHEEENIPTATQQEETEDAIEEKTEKETVKTLESQTQNEPSYSFGTLLLAILIPCILIIIAYLIFKFVKF